MYNETKPNNKIIINLPTNNFDKILSLQEALAYFKQEPQLINYNIVHLIPINLLIDLLNISRSSFEINMLKNENLRHFEITGNKLPKNRYYFDVKDIVEFLIDHCNLTYFKFQQLDDGSIRLAEQKGNQITNEDKTLLQDLLIRGSWASSKQLEEQFCRTRRIISRLQNIVDSITFSFSGSQRHFRRVLLIHNHEYYLNIIKKYKKYEEKIINS